MYLICGIFRQLRASGSFRDYLITYANTCSSWFYDSGQGGRTGHQRLATPSKFVTRSISLDLDIVCL